MSATYSINEGPSEQKVLLHKRKQKNMHISPVHHEHIAVFWSLCCVLRVLADEVLLSMRVSPPLGNPLVKQSCWPRDGGMQ